MSRWACYALAAMLAMSVPAAMAEPADTDREAELRRLRAEVEAQKQQLQKMEERLKELEESRTAAPATTEPARAPSSPALFNPAISVIGLVEGRTSSDKTNQANNRFDFQELELAITANVDPTHRAALFLALPAGETVELEEGYIESLNFLGLGLHARGGFLKNAFGRVNTEHAHNFIEIDAPTVLDNFVGEEGLRGPGFSFRKAIDLSDKSLIELTGEIVSNDNDVLGSAGQSQRLVPVGHARFFTELSETSTLELGASFARFSNGDLLDDDGNLVQNNLSNDLFGIDVRYKWRPLDNANKSLLVQAEYFKNHRTTAPGLGVNGGTTIDTDGLYASLRYQFARQWAIGYRYDDAGLPFDPALREQAHSVTLSYLLNEFNLVRLQGKSASTNFAGNRTDVFFQWNFVVGPHGVHKY